MYSSWLNHQALGLMVEPTMPRTEAIGAWESGGSLALCEAPGQGRTECARSSLLPSQCACVESLVSPTGGVVRHARLTLRLVPRDRSERTTWKPAYDLHVTSNNTSLGTDLVEIPSAFIGCVVHVVSLTTSSFFLGGRAGREWGWSCL